MKTLAAATLALLTVTSGSLSARESESQSPFDASFIDAHSARFSIEYRDVEGVAKGGGWWTDQVKVNQNRLIRTVVRYTEDGTADLERTVIADRKTLKPYLMDQRFGPSRTGVMHVDFTEDGASQLLIQSPLSAMQRIDVQFERDVWELSLWGTLAMSLPFNEGAVHTVATVAPNRQGIREIAFRVEGNEVLQFGGEELETTVVSIPEENWRFWVRKSAPYILRIEHPAPGGLTAISTLVEVE